MLFLHGILPLSVLKLCLGESSFLVIFVCHLQFSFLLLEILFTLHLKLYFSLLQISIFLTLVGLLPLSDGLIVAYEAHDYLIFIFNVFFQTLDLQDASPNLVLTLHLQTRLFFFQLLDASLQTFIRLRATLILLLLVPGLKQLILALELCNLVPGQLDE